MASGKLFLLTGVGVAAILAFVIVFGAAAKTTVTNNMEEAAKKIASTVEGQDNSTDTRTLAQGQDENAQTQVVNVKEQADPNHTEKFLVISFTLEPHAAKSVVFHTAAADRVFLVGKATVEGPGLVSFSVDRPATCALCDTYSVKGNEHPAYGLSGASNGDLFIQIKPDKEQTLLMENSASVAQKVNVDLSIEYRGLVASGQ